MTARARGRRSRADLVGDPARPATSSCGSRRRPPAPGFTAEAMGGDRIRLVAVAGGEEVVLTELDGRFWTAETCASFTGRVVGLYATDGTPTFADLRYRGEEDAAQFRPGEVAAH